LVGTFYDLVIDIGEVLDIFDLVAFESQITPNDIEDYVGHGVADMAFIIGGDAANIHRHHFATGMKILLPPG
jgi:hypothetical protein